MLFFINEKSFICKAKLHILANEKSIVEMFLKSVFESVRISTVVMVFSKKTLQNCQSSWVHVLITKHGNGHVNLL